MRRERHEQRLLAAARRGEEDAFRDLVAPLRGSLEAHCRRMLGSTHDAEDATQEALFRAWRALPGFEGRASLRAWLYRIATNTCLSAIERRPKRVVLGAPEDHGEPLSESSWRHADEGPGDDFEQRETAAVAVGIALRRLTPGQRSVLIFRDVLGFSARETASALDTTVATVTSALQRARAALDDALEGDDRPLSPIEVPIQDAVEGFVGALRRGDVEAVVGIAADTTLTAPRAWTYSPLPAY
jgi:RNA polymerase sigma-70 factor, ECF subfamily